MVVAQRDFDPAAATPTVGLGRLGGIMRIADGRSLAPESPPTDEVAGHPDRL
jgi:hypothetical protein